MSIRFRPSSRGTQARAATDLSIWLLGGFRVSASGRSIDDSAWRLRKARSLIKVLALAPGHRLHRERVVEILWPDLDADSADNNLRQVLHFARHALQPELTRRGTPDHLQLHDDVIHLSAEGRIWIDVAAFEAAAAAARRARNLAAYRAAVASYAGELLPEDLYEDWALRKREELQHLSRALLLDLARLEEEAQEFRSAQATLERLLADDPAHEEAHAGLIRLYATVGERHAALQQYQRLTDTLKREVGAEPDAATRRLYEEILAGRFPPDVAGTARVRHAPRKDASLRKRLSRTRPPVARGTPARPAGNVPSPLTSFVGRQQELTEIRQLLATVRLMTLSGPGGSGKTRLGLELAAHVTEAFPDGTWFVDLAPLTNPALVEGTVAKVFGIGDRQGQSPTERLLEHLRPRHALLVLDNCEHLVAVCADLVVQLLRSCPNMKVVATSRQSLQVSGELVWRVPPMSLPRDDRQPSSMSDLAASDALHLFVERAQLVRSGFALDDHTAPIAVEICRRLEGLPLAIELAAARLRILSPNELLDRLHDRFEMLAGEFRDVPERHRTQRAAIAWSYDLLSPPDQQLFNRLAVFRGGFTLDAVGAVWAHSSADGGVLEAITQLVDKSMLMVEEGAGYSVRYRLLESLREYAWEHLVAGGQAQSAQNAHARHFLELAERAAPELTGASQSMWMDRLEAERDNLRAAVRWWALQHDARTALRMSNALQQFWFTRGYLTEGRSLMTELLSLDSSGAADLNRARAMTAVGRFAWSQGDFTEATRFNEEALRMFRALDHKSGIGNALRNLALTARAQGYPEEARRMYEEVLAIDREANDRAGVAITLQNLGVLLDGQGHYTAARSLFEEKLSIEKERDDPVGIAYALLGLGYVATKQGDYDAARGFYDQSLSLRRDIGDKTGIAATLSALGELVALQGDLTAGRHLLDEALALAREVGDRPRIGRCLAGLGDVAFKAGDLVAARSCLSESLSTFNDLGSKDTLPSSLEAFALLAAAEGQPERALRLAAAASVRRERLGTRLPPAREAAYGRELAGARELLRPDVAEAAWAEGRAMSDTLAVHYALRSSRTVSPQSDSSSRL